MPSVSKIQLLPNSLVDIMIVLSPVVPLTDVMKVLRAHIPILGSYHKSYLEQNTHKTFRFVRAVREDVEKYEH